MLRIKYNIKCTTANVQIAKNQYNEIQDLFVQYEIIIKYYTLYFDKELVHIVYYSYC